MSRKHIFSPQANTDIEGIIDYTIANWGISKADKYIDEIEEICEKIALFPSLGVEAEEFGEGVRMFPHSQHNIFYTLKSEAIIIIRILNSNLDILNIKLN